ncbi:hypothetical protein [Altererythrobacter lauratis]|uniref:Autotransporter outer membrane beta-barrel domain-containing protein n=1 Tax=Alteraurantiacibacter lauratis TaxID=2054627 RepID=A0ABV7EEN6_9SPHN
MNGSPNASSAARGQPLMLLALVLAGWVLLRAFTWTSPLPELGPVVPQISARFVAAPQAVPRPPAPAPETARGLPQDTDALSGPFDPANWNPAPLEPASPPARDAAPEPPSALPAAPAAPGDPAAEIRRAGMAENKLARPVQPKIAAGHALLMAAGFSQMRMIPQIAQYFAATTVMQASATAPAAPSVSAAPPAAAARSSASNASRWSADGWMMWRKDTTTPITSGRPSYGRSQAGAVLRFDLAAASHQRPQAYLRGAAALQGAPEEEAALGLSIRPLAVLPVRVAAEMRMGNRAGQTALRPAAYAVTELPVQRLPAGFAGEAYIQAGYVGGRDATAFVDGQARVDRSLASNARGFDLRAGGGAWGGAQADGARLDVGPSASLAFRLGDARARLAADYRFRVAGDAEPASGPALTLSAGF